MHAAFEYFKAKDSKDDATAYVVYVWDTRKVVDTGFTYPKNYNIGQKAVDNHKPLVFNAGGDETDNACKRVFDKAFASKTTK